MFGTDYIILKEKSTEQLEKEVKRHFIRSWRLQGSIFVLGDRVCHAMVK